MNLVEKLLDYRNNRNSEIFENVKKDNLTVIVTELLSWLKLERKREIWIEQGKKTCLKPLELNFNYPWCNDLVEILNGDNCFSEVFYVSEKKLYFKENVDQNYIQEARRLAYDMYNPEMIIN